MVDRNMIQREVCMYACICLCMYVYVCMYAMYILGRFEWASFECQNELCYVRQKHDPNRGMYACMHVSMSVYIYIYIYICRYTDIYIYIYIQKYLYTYMYMNIHRKCMSK